MTANNTPIRSNTQFVVITDRDHNHWGPCGSIISQHQSYKAAVKSRDKNGGYGRIVHIDDLSASL